MRKLTGLFAYVLAEPLLCKPRLNSVGPQVDISDISRLRRMPISQDSLSNPMGQHRDQTEKIFLLEPINS
jgi:hypothetical protein